MPWLTFRGGKPIKLEKGVIFLSNENRIVIGLCVCFISPLRAVLLIESSNNASLGDA